MKPQEMASFAIDNVEPLKDQIYGNRYRVAAHLNDGTYLPCLVLQKAASPPCAAPKLLHKSKLMLVSGIKPKHSGDFPTSAEPTVAAPVRDLRR